MTREETEKCQTKQTTHGTVPVSDICPTFSSHVEKAAPQQHNTADFRKLLNPDGTILTWIMYSNFTGNAGS